LSDLYKVAIVGSGPAGMSAAGRAAALGMSHVLLEKTDHLSDTIFKYQKGKHVMATPSNLVLRSDMDFDAGKRETILGIWDEQTAGHGVNVKYNAEVAKVEGEKGNFTLHLKSGETVKAETIVLAIGTQGNPNLMRCPGADLPHVQYQLDDPTEYIDEHIVIVGTGSCGLARLSGQTIKIGGYGFPISDEGSGAYLGLHVVRAAMMAHDGRIASTALLGEIMGRFGDDAGQAVQWMDRATATDYAAFAPIVVRHADQGDPAARRIMQDAAAAIETIGRALFERGAERLSLIGGLASVIESWLAPDLRRRLSPQLGDSLDGAAILAGRPATVE